MFDKIVSEDPFLIVYCPDKYKIQIMCREAVNDSLAALKLKPDWIVISKMINELFTIFKLIKIYLYFNQDYINAVFSCNEMGILNIDPNNINLGNNFDKDDPNTVILIRILAWLGLTY